jgi:hypothetical protein
MNKPFFVLITLFCLASMPGFCINQMEELFWINGVQPYGNFGQGLAALDFNGDGYDDLAVLHNGWQPDSLSNQPELKYGRILIYYGGPGFDSTPDFVIEGTYHWQFYQIGNSGYLVNMGDVNNDGFEDLGVRGYTDSSISWGVPYIAIYYGSANPALQPGYYRPFPNTHSDCNVEIEPLGDINNDGYDDFCYSYSESIDYNEPSSIAIILGGSLQEITWRQFSNWDSANVSSIGDANQDGFDDYIVTYSQWLGNGNYFNSNTLYFGNANIAPVDSLVLYSSTEPITNRAKYLGDLNGDGKDDFAGLLKQPFTYVWFGNENLSDQADLLITPNWTGGITKRGLVFGDLNNDGYDDVIGSAPMDYGQTGAFKFWLGGANMNSTSDLTIIGHLSGMLFGTGLAAGDFNGDGYCDVAVSEPHSQTFDSTPGRVYIYAGNAELADTTVNVDDDSQTPEVTGWTFKVIPNPMRGKKNWKLRFSGAGYNKYNDLSVRIHNLKGQRLKSIPIPAAQLKSGEVNLPELNLPGGIYEVSLYNRGVLLKSKKATIK